MKKIVVGNQKAVLEKDSVLNFIKFFENNDLVSEVVICPSFVFIPYFEKSKFILGSQDVSIKNGGATTGDVSSKQLKSMNISYSIVGHSERREIFNDLSTVIVEKINRLYEEGITPILCVGENKEEKENNTTKDVIAKELIDVFDNISKDREIIVAYEPIWAIGTGLVPTLDEIDDIVSFIKDFISDKYKKNVKVLYGGSVNSKNIDELNKTVSDGYLIGGASCKEEEFLHIIEKCL